MALTPAVFREEVGKLFDDLRIFLDSSGNIIFAVTQVDEDGNVAVVLASYKISNIDADGTPNFYGFERADGGWYILKETLSAGADVYEYLKGSSDLATTWATRTTDTYDTFANTF